MAEDRAIRLEQIKAALAIEWRLKTEQGVHHDHLSDLAFLVAELEFTQSRRDAAEAQVQALQQALREAVEFWAYYSDINEGAQDDICDERLEMLERMRTVAGDPAQEPR